ncbi:MAG: FecR domain-containing protein [Novosphingobium sp.]|nr:FecR domain-containing protein [Novosphingobium sp.]
MKLNGHLLVPMLAVAAAAVASQPASAQVVGVTAAVRNEVRMTTVANPEMHAARLKERVAIGNDIATGKASMAQLLLLDRTSFSVGSSARVRIDRFVYDPRKSASSVTGSVAKGAFRFMSGGALRRGTEKSSVRTPVATIGIRGTIFEGVVGEEAVTIARREGLIGPNDAVDPEGATLVVLRGPGSAAEGGMHTGAIDVTANGVTVPVEEPGGAVFVARSDENPIGPFRLGDRGLEMIHQLLRAEPLPEEEQWWTSDLVTDRQFECSDTDRGGATFWCHEMN